MKSTDKNNRMTHVQIKKAADNVGRPVQKVEAVYCDVTRRCEVTVLAGPSDPGFRTVPVGGGE